MQKLIKCLCYNKQLVVESGREKLDGEKVAVASIEDELHGKKNKNFQEKQLEVLVQKSLKRENLFLNNSKTKFEKFHLENKTDKIFSKIISLKNLKKLQPTIKFLTRWKPRKK